MITTDKLVICVAPTSNFHGKEANPALPEQPDEVAEEVYKCWNDGASIVHIHARDKNGVPTNDPDVFREIDQKIRAKKCDIIIQHSTAPALRVEAFKRGEPINVWDGVKSIEPKPEMASLNAGLGAVMYRGLEAPIPWTRSFIETNAKRMLDMGIKPEIEIYNTGMMEDVYNLIDKGLLTKPYWLSFVMGMNKVNQGAVRYSPRLLATYVDLLPAEAMFTTLGIMETEIQACTLSILLGGHVRVGFEDNINYRRGEKARDNAQLVARIAMFGRELGREIASPSEARELLGMPQLRM